MSGNSGRETSRPGGEIVIPLRSDSGPHKESDETRPRHGAARGVRQGGGCGIETKKTIVRKALEELGIHATIEEEIFCPSVGKDIDAEDGIMNAADEEHHVAKVLIAELEEMNGNETARNGRYQRSKLVVSNS